MRKSTIVPIRICLNSPETTLGAPACVARRVGNKEIANQQKAREAATKEWKRLWEKDAWGATIVREWYGVVVEARKSNVNVHMGRLFGIMVEKAAELPEGPTKKVQVPSGVPGKPGGDPKLGSCDIPESGIEPSKHGSRQSSGLLRMRGGTHH